MKNKKFIFLSLIIVISLIIISNLPFESVSDAEPIVYYVCFDQIEIIHPIGKTTRSNITTLPSNLIISPNLYIYNGKIFNLSKEGLYRFIITNKDNQQRVVYEKNLDALISAIAWIHTHGNSDNHLSNKELTKKATKSKIFLTCGHVSSWALHILNSLGIKARLVGGLTLEEWNGYDDGHTLIEVYREDLNKWTIYDIDNNCYFLKDGRPLSLLEFTNLSSSGDFEIKFISYDIRVDISNFKNEKTGFSYAFLSEKRVATNETLKRWYKRVMQVPMIKEGNFWYFFDLTNKSRIETYSKSYKYMDKKNFINKFYSVNNT